MLLAGAVPCVLRAANNMQVNCVHYTVCICNHPFRNSKLIRLGRKAGHCVWGKSVCMRQYFDLIDMLCSQEGVL